MVAFARDYKFRNCSAKIPTSDCFRSKSARSSIINVPSGSSLVGEIRLFTCYPCLSPSLAQGDDQGLLGRLGEIAYNLPPPGGTPGIAPSIRTLTEDDGPNRAPDFIQIGLAISIPNKLTKDHFGWAGTITIDRYGRIYAAPIGAGLGKSQSDWIPGTNNDPGFTATVNWMNQYSRPSRDELSSFLSGNGWNVTGGYWFGGQLSGSTSSTMTATGHGIMSPQFGIGDSYSILIYDPNPND